MRKLGKNVDRHRSVKHGRSERHWCHVEAYDDGQTDEHTLARGKGCSLRPECVLFGDIGISSVGDGQEENV